MIHQRYLPYAERLALRDPESIEWIVLHCTELPDLAMARDYGERIHHTASQTGNSGHFYIDRDGRTEQWVPVNRTAHHVRGHNEHSIGIELVNLGRYPHWFDSRRQEMSQPYPGRQIQSLIDLLAMLASEMPMLKWICGHEQLDREQVVSSDQETVMVRRKLDPGPRFPWREVLDNTSLKFFGDSI